MDKVELRACLVSSRVRLGGAKSASFTEGTATCEPFLRGSILHFRRVSTEHTLLREVLYVPRNVNRLNPHLYKTGSKSAWRVLAFAFLRAGSSLGEGGEGFFYGAEVRRVARQEPQLASPFLDELSLTHLLVCTERLSMSTICPLFEGWRQDVPHVEPE